jgi:LysM repeat protein
MKILKIFGVVVGIHVFFIISAFVIPGCSSASKSTPKPEETVARTEPPPSISVAPAPSDSGPPLMSPAPISFGPEPAGVPMTGSSGGRFTPTRPGTPAASTLVTSPVQDVTPATPYTVKSGDNLSTIAKKHDTTVAKLAAANNIKTSAILQPGQRLLIPGKPAQSAAAPASGNLAAPTKAASGMSAPAASNEVKYTVKAGDSLSKIAQQFGVKASELATVNHIADPRKLAAGAVLTIPGWKAGNSAKPSPKADEPPPKSGAAATPVEMAPLFNPSAPVPSDTRPAGDVPVIKVDELPTLPAPKGN